MAERSNVATVRAAYDAFARRDVEALVALIDPDCEFWAVTGDAAGREGPYRGHAGMRQYFADVAALWATVELSVETIHDSGDQIVAAGRVHARSAGGQEIDQPVAWLWQLRDGKVSSVQVHASRALAMEALGRGS